MSRKVLILILLLTLSLTADSIELSLKKFAGLVATEHNINLIISDDIDEDEVIFHIDRQRPPLMLAAFKKMLSLLRV